MQILHDYPLKSLNTFGIEAYAKEYVQVGDVSELKQILEFNRNKKKLILGGGSNMLLTKNIDALVININLKGIEVVDETTESVIIKCGAGETWHQLVMHCINLGFGGLENLSLIPGNVGTAPIQNIGAYGVELKDVFEKCQTIHTKTGELREFTKGECKFGYRESVFKNELKGEYIITHVFLKLSKHGFHRLHTEYGAIRSKLEEFGKSPSIETISEAVIAIRKEKLPDPKEIGNSGSFFKNPVVSSEQYKKLLEKFPEIPSYPISDSEVKVPAGWLIEKAGFKGKTFGNYGVHKNQALVLVNYGGASGKEIFRLAKIIQATVMRIFGISITPEVNII
ncbi:UDP-N-acetylmuramate dehydrogenase [Aegicerativicinus sediminis]